jgi:nitroimidazol reductase NimA-like FMN-containing flavoprotein (pyridoxamine 5'-phosphate oxidase superfamily)
VSADDRDDAAADHVRDYEDVSGFVLTDERERELVTRQNECTFMWTTREGEPVGVIMNYVWRDGRFWLTATRRRKRIAALERDPRVAIALSSRGTGIGTSMSLTYKGRAVLHDDDATKAWFYPALAAAVRPGAPEQQEAFARFLDSPGRVVIEVVPSARIGFDSAAMFRGSPAGPSRTELDE